jgi:hypothetical protein
MDVHEYVFIAVTTPDGLVHAIRYSSGVAHIIIGMLHETFRRYVSLECGDTLYRVHDKTANLNIKRINCLECLIAIYRRHE